MSTPTIAERVANLMTLIKAAITPGLSEELQTEFAAIVKLLPDVELSGDVNLVGSLEISVAALCQEPPNLKIAVELRRSIEARLKKTTRFFYRILSGGSPATRVVLGLGGLLYFVIPFALAFGPIVWERQELFGVDASMLALVAIAGAMGSIVSMLVRLQDFSQLSSTDPSMIFFTGFFKPIIGMSFALFVFAILSSGLLPLTIHEDKIRYFFAAISFISGFSERFARDIVDKAEDSLSLGNEHGAETTVVTNVTQKKV